MGQPVIRVTAMPADTNPYGGVFGGWLMSQMALGAGSLASRHANGTAVVIGATDFRFPGAMAVGDELSIYADIAGEGNTSIEIAVRGISRERNGEATKEVCSGSFTFVVVNDEGRPRAVKDRPTYPTGQEL
ncbi:acyl-CoA thioesterase [Croceicoccus naphthovorans]|uniref:Acyl-CoA thioester hydrolase n=1 Tax=Croceicoccus naphthovorans TaxID=1348774 RepID=A0A0G3XET9_9SPHN|nr:hotdog domain-containing protein [Croceicoccus naphthovorans]AKM10025.1 acyl-CoA thioester hydrolase [Croceicoccus naphthovorans]MBB3991092.1 acyl-CoA thioesterase YciA [Croceicoccus naphthovorans]